MKESTYTPGHSDVSRRFMARRSLETHAEFIRPYVKSNSHVLDCGCGPGTISAGIAAIAVDGSVHGIDFSRHQIDEARQMHRLQNLSFDFASVYELPYEDHRFDIVLAHALFEHIGNPLEALREIDRVLAPGGFVGLCSPDFAAFVLTPETKRLRDAFSQYRRIQEFNGGDTLAGRRLLTWLCDAGFTPLKTQGRCENYSYASKKSPAIQSVRIC